MKRRNATNPPVREVGEPKAVRPRLLSETPAGFTRKNAGGEPFLTRKGRDMNPSVAVVGATGVVGELMRTVLEERNFPVRSIKFLASERSAGKSVRFGGQNYPVEPL